MIAKAKKKSPGIVARRERIVEQTRKLIATQGIKNIRMRALAEQCNVATATLYNQFGSRDGIIAAALEADFRGRFEPLSQKTESLLPSEKIRQRIELTATDVTQLKDYTRSVMFFYFHHETIDSLRSMIHDFVAEDFLEIIYQIKELGDLADWVRADEFADDIVTELYSLSMKWTQGYIPQADLYMRLMQSACASFIGISTGKTKREFEQIISSLNLHR